MDSVNQEIPNLIQINCQCDWFQFCVWFVKAFRLFSHQMEQQNKSDYAAEQIESEIEDIDQEEKKMNV